MKWRWLIVGGVLLALGANQALATFNLVAPEKTIPGDPGLTQTVWQSKVAPFGKYDKIGLHRYRSDRVKPVAVMFYLPGTNMNGDLKITDPSHNLWLYLAERGIVVYAMDYRTHFVPDTPIPDLRFMRGWTMTRFVDDGKLALAQVRESSPGLPVFVAGFSRGVGYAYALSGEEPVAGLIALDGSFKRYREKHFNQAAAMKQLAASGHWASILARSRGWKGRVELMQRAADNPNGPAMGKFPTIGAQVASLLYYSWGPGVLANPKGGISSVKYLAAAMADYDRFFPTIQNIEGRAIADQTNDPETSLDDHFGHMTVPVIYFGSTGMGPNNLMSGIYSASKCGSKDVTINVLEHYGHLDVLYGNRARHDVYAVVDRWIDHHLGSAARSD